MKITFLGTSAGTPTRERNVTSQALTFTNGGLWLLDCGEATQHQFIKLGLKASRCERILITHLHGDHCYGLPGMLMFIAISGRIEPVEVAGPPGIREFLTTILRISEAELPYRLTITELPADGGSLESLGGWQATAHPIAHRVTCLGWCLTEDQRPGRFHVDRAQRIGVPEGALFGQLQRGEPIRLADGRIVVPSDVTDPPRPGRKVILLGDTSDPSGIAAAAEGCDLLVCEATYDQERPDKAVAWGHSTTAMTGAFAHKINAKRLIITHFSSRYTDTSPDVTVADLLAETKRACPRTEVYAATDLWSFAIEPLG